MSIKIVPEKSEAEKREKQIWLTLRTNKTVKEFWRVKEERKQMRERKGIEEKNGK